MSLRHDKYVSRTNREAVPDPPTRRPFECDTLLAYGAKRTVVIRIQNRELHLFVVRMPHFSTAIVARKAVVHKERDEGSDEIPRLRSG
jgi:hypothetical protein